MSVATSSSEDSDEADNKMMFILDTDSTNSKYNCLLTTCPHKCTSVSTILNHMWKFKKKNVATKKCTGQNSPSITLYPKLFREDKFKQCTYPALKQEYPYLKWESVKKYINTSNGKLPNIIALIREFSIFITSDYLSQFPNIKIPKNLQHFILEKDFEADELSNIIASNENNSNTNTHEPAHKKRKISHNESMELSGTAQTQPSATTLSLPSLNMSPKSSNHTNSLINQISSNSSLSFDLNQYKNGNNKNKNKNHNLSVIIPSSMTMSASGNTNSKKRKRKRCVGPVCNACNTELNPCQTMIKCAECVNEDLENTDTHSGDVIICICCFKQGREFMTHKRFHKYIVLRPLVHCKLQGSDMVEDEAHKIGRKAKFSHNKWNANSEWNLLAGIRKYGLGNWSGITKMINKQNINTENIRNLDAKHVEAHFHLKYKESVYKSKEELSEEKTNDFDMKSLIFDKNKKRGKKGRKSVSLAPNNSNKFTDKHKLKCGYRELRDEFEAEWNNDAEAMIGDMYFSEYDTPKERVLKMEGLRLYNAVLSKRKVRKQFVKDYGVIYGKRARNKRALTESEAKLEREISDNLSKFARFTADKNRNFSEFKKLTHGLMEEKQIRERIYKLRHYLLNGVTSLSQMNTIEEYVERQQELKREKDESHFERKRDEFDSEDETIMPSNSEDCMSRYHGCSLDSISTYLSLLEQEQKRGKKGKKKSYASAEESSEEIALQNWNLEKMDGFGALSEGEQKLCNVLKIGPKDYKWIEQQIAKRVCMHGLIGAKDKVPQQLHIDIGDCENVRETMTMRIGLVDPRVLVDNAKIDAKKKQ